MQQATPQNCVHVMQPKIKPIFLKSKGDLGKTKITV